MKIAIATFAQLPVPPVKGGAVETLLDYICTENEISGALEIDVFSIYDETAVRVPQKTYTKYTFIYNSQLNKFSLTNVLNKVFKTRKFLNVNIKKYITEINKQEYDFVIITSIFWELEFIADKINSPVIWYLHADALSVLNKNDIDKILSKCKAVITVSDFVSGRIEALSPKCRVITVKNCSGIKPISEEREQEVSRKIREKYGIAEDDILFTYVGRIMSIKGIKELVTAFNQLSVNNKKLLIVGSPATQEDYEYLEELKCICDKKVIFAGYIENQNLNEIYCATDAAVVPSICFEAAGLTVIEPQLCGRYVIAANIGGIPEYCENGRLVEYDDNFIENLKNAMADFCNNKDFYVSNRNRLTKYNKKSYYTDFCNVLKIIQKERELCQD